MSETKERPILFSGAMVRAILGGHKTQTRRVVKTPIDPNGTFRVRESDGEIEDFSGGSWGVLARRTVCPYGVPGDRLWVRETWCKPSEGDLRNESLRSKAGSIEYAADMGRERFYVWCNFTPQLSDFRWRSPIHMPRWASRLTLDVVNVRVERLQDISEEDALTEIGGCGLGGGCCKRCNGAGSNHTYPQGCPDCSGTGHAHRIKFSDLWDSINGKTHPWASNPWVWVVEFSISKAVK